ncbi:unnamed protein product [Paramecium sonneborni]|uniref:Uncharacterized protein n=1 Tax=Paramecium sonneborni TaxID=65129 RepID=A0A8S1QL28_9CILI|nr:unnamed protein product [Paramecium sonneborni]
MFVMFFSCWNNFSIYQLSQIYLIMGCKIWGGLEIITSTFELCSFHMLFSRWCKVKVWIILFDY